jgi:hypothetical protein
MYLKIIKNKILPPKGFKAISLFPFIFTKTQLAGRDINHEKIHHKQQLELIIIPFFLVYLVLHLIYGYKKNPFEIEAYQNEDDQNYLKNRKLYSWTKYLK